MRTVIIPAPWRAPVEVLGAFADEPFALALLSDGEGERGRWSYLARDPAKTLVIDPDDPRDTFAALAELIGPTTPALASGPPFQGGVAGLTSYEMGARTETLVLRRRPGWPDLACARYEALLAFDHARREVLAIGRGSANNLAERRARGALAWLAAPASPLQRGRLAGAIDHPDAQSHEAAVAEVVARIAAGEVFQANIARAWTGALATGVRPFDVAARLASESPAPFAGYLRLPGLAVVSNSPERFVRVTRHGERLRAETRPIKGTAPRGPDAEEDARLARALTVSAKDRAENLMIVDLMRNDLARVCDAGAVKTNELFAVETYPNVHHLVSTVTGRLRADRSAIDLLAAAFPPGSITGAPKVQAMKLIAQLEPPRGPFFGALFWAGFDGGFDSSVLIRTLAFEEAPKGAWCFEARAGGGVVADSDPLAERLETEAKISAILGALGGEPPPAAVK